MDDLKEKRFIARAGGNGEPIGRDSCVTLHFSLLLSSGEERDTTRRGKPAVFRFGDGNLLPGFEEALLGMVPGDDSQLTIAAKDAFGLRNPANVRVMPKADFSDLEEDGEFEEGLILSFKAPDGELPGVIVEVFEESLKIDFNHPLSGEDIIFDVSIINVENSKE